MLTISTQRDSRNKSRLTNPFVLVLGGGRWAFTFVAELLKLATFDSDIAISTTSGYIQAKERFQLDKSNPRIKVVKGLDHVNLANCRFAIVANSARSHFSSAKFLISRGIPTLIEKPVGLSMIEISELVKLSREYDTIACTSNVYLFSGAVARYAEQMERSVDGLSIAVEWLDNLSTRALGGNHVLYDDSVPIYNDWLPHIVSILDYVGLWPMSLDYLDLDHGGASVTLKCSSYQNSCEIKLSRHELVKSRTLRVESPTGMSTAVDFTAEPGALYRNSELMADSSRGQHSAGPLSKMLTSFISVIEGIGTDSKLDLDMALRAAQFIDTVEPRYLTAQKLWVERHCDRCKVPTKGIIYAVTERMQAKGRMSEVRLGRELRDFRRRYAESADVIHDYW